MAAAMVAQVNLATSVAHVPLRRMQQQQREPRGSSLRRAFFPRGRMVACASAGTSSEGSEIKSVLNRRLALMGVAGTVSGGLWNSGAALAVEEDAELAAIRKEESERLAQEALERYNRMRSGPKTKSDPQPKKSTPSPQARGGPSSKPNGKNFGDRAKPAPKNAKADKAAAPKKPGPAPKKSEPAPNKPAPAPVSASKKPAPASKPAPVAKTKPALAARAPVEQAANSASSRSSSSDASVGESKGSSARDFDLGSAGIGAGVGALSALGGLAVLVAGGGGSGVAQAVRGRGAVFVAGATGRTGRRLVRELLSRGIKVRAGVRSLDKGEEIFTVSEEDDEEDEYGEGTAFEGYLTPAEANRLTLVEFNLGPETTDDEVAESLEGASSVVCCLGAPESLGGLLQVKKIDGDATKKLIRAAQIAPSVRQFVMVSSLGTGKSGWPASVLNLFGGILTVKRGSEVALEDSGLDYLIVRPGGMERPTDSYKDTHNVILQPADTLFGGQVSRLQVAELIAAAVTNPGASRNKIVEAIAETTAEQRSYSELLASIPSAGGAMAGADKADAEFRPAGGLARGRTVKGNVSLSPGAQRKVSRLEQQTARDNLRAGRKAGGTMFTSQALARGREAYVSSLEEQTAADNPRPGALEGLKRGGTMFVSALNAGMNAALIDLKEEQAAEARKNTPPKKRGGTMFASQVPRGGGAEVVRATPVKKRGGTVFMRGPVNADGEARDPGAIQRDAAARNRETMEALKARMEAAKQARKAEVAEASRRRAAEYSKMEALKAKELAKAQAEAQREAERAEREYERKQAQAQRESEREERKRAQTLRDPQGSKAREPVAAVPRSIKEREEEISDESVNGEGWMARAMGWEEVPDPRDQ